MDCNRILILTIAISVCCRVGGMPNPMCDKREADHCFFELTSMKNFANQLMNHSSGEKISVEVLNNICNNVNESAQCVMKYLRHCLDPFTRQIVRFALGRIDDIIHDRCDRKALQEFAESHGACLVKHVDTFEDCVMGNLARLQHTDKYPPAKRIPMACCLFYEITHCVSEVSDKNCGKETTDYILSIVGAAVDDLLDLVCYEHDSHENEKCKALGIDKLPTGTKLEYESFFFNIEMIARSFSG